MDQDTNHLEELTWEDAEERIESADFVAIACGSIEQHSLHLPLAVDKIRSEEFLKEMARKGPDHDIDILILPTIPYGNAEQHMHFAGTITLSPDTLSSLITEVGRSLKRHDVERFLIVNGHRGNEGAIMKAIDTLERSHELATHYIRPLSFTGPIYTEKLGDSRNHAAAGETSEMEYYAPELVRTERKEAPTVKPWPESRPARYLDDVSDIGGTGDPTTSDSDVAEQAIQESLESVLELLKRDIKHDN